MTGKEYADIIDGFDVENNSKYLPSGGYTYCNIFAQDVADACDTPLPTGGCENMWNLWLVVCEDEHALLLQKKDLILGETDKFFSYITSKTNGDVVG